MTPPAFTPQPPLIRDALEPWCAAGATGVLRVLGPPGGTIYLSNGHISYAECPLASGVNRLLTASGRLSMEEFRGALSAGRVSHDIASELTRPGLLMPTEVEVVFYAALYGAAHFLFDARSVVRFEIGAHHPMGTVIDLDLPTMRTEIDRRRHALHAAWPDAAVDSLPVAAARRLDGQNVSLTALQWEIVVAAGRRRTPIDLARVLGRDSYATVLNARRLLRSGLLQLVRSGTVAASGAASTAAPNTAAPNKPAAHKPESAKATPVKATPSKATPSKATPARATPARATPGKQSQGKQSQGKASPAKAVRSTPSDPAPRGRTGSVPRRTGASGRSAAESGRSDLRLPHRDGQPVPDWSDIDTAWSENTLVRIRDALQALP